MNVFSKLSADFPDLPILAFLSQMSANDRLAAHQVCPSWFHRAREVNQTILPSLTIVVGDYTSPFEPMDDCLNLETLHAKSSVKLLYSLEKDNPNEVNTLFSFFPPPHRHTPWNCLTFKHNQMTEETVMQILAAFAGTTELTLLIDSNNGGERAKASDYAVAFAHLVTLLTTSEKENDWRCQLTSLRVAFIRPTNIFPGPAFYKALNGLTTLESLDLSYIKVEKEELSILCQLKQISLNLDLYSKTCHKSLVDSLAKYALKNEHLTVNLAHSYDVIPLLLLNTTATDTAAAVSGNQDSPKLSNKIVHIGFIGVSSSDQEELYWPLIDLALADYLDLIIDENGQMVDRPGGSLYPLLRHERPLASVQALDLGLCMLSSHAQLQWLNLGGLLPNVKAISLSMGPCVECCYTTFRKMSRPAMNEGEVRRFTACLRYLLGILALDTRLPHTSITYDYSEVVGAVEYKKVLVAGGEDNPLYNKFT